MDWDKRDFALQPITKDLLDGLSRFERIKCREGYAAWRDRARLQDKRQSDYIRLKKYRAVNREKLKEHSRLYYVKNKETYRKYAREYRKRPAVKERKKRMFREKYASDPEFREKIRAFNRKYAHTPRMKAWRREYVKKRRSKQ